MAPFANEPLRNVFEGGYFDIISGVKRKKKGKDGELLIFDSMRKPTAPPTRKFGSDVLEEKMRPSLRKTKHKKPVDPES